MPAELGGSQISSLLEALPGIASVLRSPVADALIKAIRAAAGIGDFAVEDADELGRYAVRRGLIGPDEGDRVLADVHAALKAKRKTAPGAKAATKKKKSPPPPPPPPPPPAPPPPPSAWPAPLVAVPSSTGPRIPAVVAATSAAARADSSASCRTSSATTANPFPCSPARAASIAAFSANRFVWEEIRLISSTKSSIAALCCASCCTCVDVVCTTSRTESSA